MQRKTENTKSFYRSLVFEMSDEPTIRGRFAKLLKYNNRMERIAYIIIRTQDVKITSKAISMI